MNARHAERGQILPFVGLSLAILMGFAAFAVDLGYLRYQQRLQQTAADSAALAADWALYSLSSPTNSTCGDSSGAGAPTSVCTAGQNAATNNGFSSATSCSGTATVCVTINYPPQSGAYQGSTSAVEAIVKAPYPGFFSQFLGSSTNWVSTRAVAIVKTSPNCTVHRLDAKDLTVNAGAQVTAPCGILVAGSVNASSANLIDVPSVGASGSVSCSQPSPCPATTIVTSGVPAISRSLRDSSRLCGTHCRISSQQYPNRESILFRKLHDAP